MGKYRIHLGLMSGKLIYSDPLDVDEMEAEDAVSHCETIVKKVSEGRSITFLIAGQKKTYLYHAIESIWWTDGS